LLDGSVKWFMQDLGTIPSAFMAYTNTGHNAPQRAQDISWGLVAMRDKDRGGPIGFMQFPTLLAT